MYAGQVVADRFEVEQRAGAGGMAVVYRARDLKSGVKVAIKVLRAWGDTHAQRLAEEARLLSTLRHPGVVQYIADGALPEGEPFLVMEWLDGEDLEARLARRPLAVEEAVSVLRAAADGLSEAHRRGIVHRDIKPGNLFLVGHDAAQLRILDFGIAQAESRTRAMTEKVTLIGTPAYMAPEQIRGQRHVTPCCDVYSLGCVAFECLAGRQPFEGKHSVAVLAKVLFEDPPRLRALRAEVPPALDALIHRMMAKAPDDRPANGGAVIELLRAYELEEQGAPTRRTLGTSPASRPGWRSEPQLTIAEQRLTSLVLVAPPAPSPDGAADSSTSVAAGLDAAVSAFGARIDVLPSGVIAAVLASEGAPFDQAARAARCALSLREAFAGAPVVLATGRGALAGKAPIGEAMDRASLLLDGAREGGAGAPERVREGDGGAPERVREGGGGAPERTREGGAGARSGVILDGITAGLLGARFDFARSSEGWALRGERGPGFGDARALLGKATPCLGRAAETAMLTAVLDEHASEGPARAVLITGPAGIGKSRLCHEVLRARRERGDPVQIWAAHGDPMSAATPFGLIAQLLRCALDLRDGDPLDAAREKVREGAAGPQRERLAPLLGSLAGVAFPDEDAAARTDPRLMTDRTRGAWEAFVAAACDRRPLVLLLEELHWADAPSIQFIDSLLRSQRELPLLVLALARPEVRSRFPRLWEGRALQEIHLKELAAKASDRLVRHALGDAAPRERMARIVDAAGGNPFCLEELIVAEAEGSSAEIPDTVVSRIHARLEAMSPPARRVLRAASLFGQVFWSGGVEALLGGPGAALGVETELASLVAQEIIVQRSESRFLGSVEYAFRHALVRESAHGTLTEPDRTLGHELARAWLERAAEHDARALTQAGSD